MKIRKAIEKDKEQILKLVGNLYRAAPSEVEGWRRNWLRRMKFTFVAEDKENIVGYISNTITRDSLLIGDLYVSPALRKKGIATKLFRLTEKLKSRLRKKFLRVDVRKKDAPARKFYSKSGFKF
ncbi:hypothetical protein COS75_02380 [Candidatus Pacearchaeota archaeon CG06_land_8_20_14_3_00_35_12]|nr:MAG: hypothetical protein COS75_02380 [Candidatus Pacearchaeota archaeon CG06_land_8_20_14_3_00_35_12]